MATVHNFNQEMSAIATPAGDDVILGHDTSSGVKGTYTIGQIAGGSGLILDSTATQITITAASHAGRTLTLSAAASCAVTLPAATGTGNKYRMVVAVAATGTAHTISCVGTDDMEGSIAIHDTSATDITAIAYAATATDDRITLNGTTQSGTRGTVIELQDVASGLWSATVRGAATGSYAVQRRGVV